MKLIPHPASRVPVFCSILLTSLLLLSMGCGFSTGASGDPTHLAFVSSSLPAGTVGSAYSQTVPVSGGKTPYSFSVASGTLPTGLSLSSTTGLISGTPSASGESSFTIGVMDSHSPQQTAQQAFTMRISARSAVIITTNLLPNGISNLSYSSTLAVSGGMAPYSWSISSGTLPAGLSLTGSGVISGVPTAAGSSTFTVRVQDSSSPKQNATRPFTITISTSKQTV